jgi:hypothetical protein
VFVLLAMMKRKEGLGGENRGFEQDRRLGGARLNRVRVSVPLGRNVQVAASPTGGYPRKLRETLQLLGALIIADLTLEKVVTLSHSLGVFTALTLNIRDSTRFHTAAPPIPSITVDPRLYNILG